MPSPSERSQSMPPWGLSEPYWPEKKNASGAGLRSKTRTELIRTRREELQSSANNHLREGHRKDEAPRLDQAVDWWTLAEGYRENALEDMASSPRFQRYMSKRARANEAERPDPFSTHEVRIKGPSKPLAEKISAAHAPPNSTEAYSATRRTIKHFTDEVFAWKSRLQSHANLDERGKNKRYHLDECQPMYSSLSSTFTGCSLDPKGSKAHSAYRTGTDLRAPHPLDKPTAAEVAKRALKQRRTWRELLSASSLARKTHRDNHTTSHATNSRDQPPSANSVTSTNSPGAEAYSERQLRPPSSPPESNRRRYSRLCGQG